MESHHPRHGAAVLLLQLLRLDVQPSSRLHQDFNHPPRHTNLLPNEARSLLLGPARPERPQHNLLHNLLHHSDR